MIMGGSFHHGSSSGHIHHSGSSSSHGGHSKQQTITIHDTPSPTAVITISDSEDETPDVKKASSSSKHHASTSMCAGGGGRSTNQCRTSGGASCSATASIKPSSSSSNIHHSSSSSSLAANPQSLPAVAASSSSSNSNSHHHSQYHSMQQPGPPPPHQQQHPQQHHTSVISSGSQAGICGGGSSNTGTLSGRSRKSTAVASTSTTCVTVGDSDGENDRRITPKHQAIKYEHHAGQSQKKRLLAMAQNECLLSTTNHTLHVPKQEPTEFVAYEYPQVDKRSSWAPPGSSSSSSHYSSSGHKRESSVYMPSSSSSSSAAAAAAAAAANQSMMGSGSNMAGAATVVAGAPPHAHAKNTPTGSGSSSWGAPIYRQHQPSSNTPLGSSPGALLPQQDIYAAQGDIYRRSAVFVSQAPYQTYNRVVPPPAHNASSRQVLPAHPLPAHIQFPTQYSHLGPLSPAQIANKHYAWFGE